MAGMVVDGCWWLVVVSLIIELVLVIVIKVADEFKSSVGGRGCGGIKLLVRVGWCSSGKCGGRLMVVTSICCKGIGP